MSDFKKAIEAAAEVVNAEKKVEVERLAELVEAQVGNILGGGYSQYAVHHAKDKQLEEVSE